MTGTAHSLPVAAGAGELVGRAGDVEGVVDLLGSARLVSVVGPGGVGKTRLGLAVAAEVAGDYSDGAWLVELGGARGPGEVAGVVASALGVDGHAGPAPAEALIEALRRRRLLVVLDSCEHVLAACAGLADRLLRACPQLTILATSQEALLVAGERVWQLQPLPLPGWAADDLDELAACPAVRLFVERTAARRPEFTLSAGNAPAVAEICRRLDGMPLAIELAAERAAMLGAAEVARRLDDRFGLLIGRQANTVAPRHQTLRAALDRSHDLLSGPERVLFRRLGVFAGGWTLGAAEQVCAGGAVSDDAVFDVLAALVRRSLVVAVTGPRSRYRLLDSTRAYAGDRLAEAGEAADLAARHAAWYVGLAERAEPELASGAQRAWLGRLDAEDANLAAALSYATRGEHPELGLRLAGALVLFWSMRGRLEDGMGWLERALAADGGTPAQRATALWGAGLLARALGDHTTARARAGESLDLARQLGDTRLAARGLSVLGAVGVSACDGSTMSRAQLRESVALAREVGDAWCEVSALVSMGFAHLVQGDPVAGRGCFEQCLEVAQRQDVQAGDGHRVHALIGLGRAALVAGDLPTAEHRLGEAAALARELGFPVPAANALRFLGEAAGTRGDYDTARRVFQESLDLGRRMGANGQTALALSALGRLALSQGDTAAAGRVLEEARTLDVSKGSGSGAACALTGLGAVERALGDGPEARRRLEEALSTARRAGDHEAAARALRELGLVAHHDGDNVRAAPLLHEALELYRGLGDQPALAGCLEALARLDAEEGHLRAAARLLGAAQAVRDEGGYFRAPADQPDHDAGVAVVRRALGREAFEAAWAEGAAVSVEEATAYAARGRGRRARGDSGWGRLSRRQRDVARLAAQGLTNIEIGRRLLISPRTVQTHLAHVYAKLGLSSRSQLDAVAAGQAASGARAKRAS